MVDQYLLDDLISYKIKILCCGDKAQLPAIMKANTLLDSPDYNLTQIMRQKEGSVILRLAEMARSGVQIPYGNFGDAVVLDEKSIKPETLKQILLTADQVICGLNRSRNNLNTFIRQLKGIDTEKYRCPLKDEKVICVMNNYDIFLDKYKHYNLVNGTIGKVLKDMDSSNPGLGVIDFEPDFLNETTKNIVLDPYIFTEGEFKYEQHQYAIETCSGEYLVKESFKRGKNESKEDFAEKMKEYAKIQLNASDEVVINRFEFAYAISCHKSQGSEWDNVVIFDESKAFRNDANKWLYTAITRARKKLIIIR
jgi:exodeoxyribonuclease-5